MRALQTRVQKLERGKAGDGNAQPFYILWVPAGADRVAALDELRASGKVTADVPAYCAEWKPPNGCWRGRVLGPRPVIGELPQVGPLIPTGRQEQSSVSRNGNTPGAIARVVEAIVQRVLAEQFTVEMIAM